MSLQSTVNIDSKFGIPGELIVEGPQRVESVIVNSNASSANNIGSAYTRNAASGEAQVGGVAGPGTCTVTGSISGTTLTVTAVSAGMPSIGQTITGGTISANTTITGYLAVNPDGTGTYTVNNSQTVTSGTVTGTGGSNLVFGGILVNPKQQASAGTVAGGTLAATLAIADNTQGDLLYMGTIVISSATACAIGDEVVYDIVTGALSTIVPGATPGANKRLVPNASIYRYPTSVAGLTAAKLTN